MNRNASRIVFIVLVLGAVGFYAWSGWRDYRQAAPEVHAFRAPDIPYAPTPQIVVDRMLEAARLKKTDLLYDLGSGDGRIVLTAAQSYGVKADGFDLDAALVAKSRAAARALGLDRLVSFERRDILTLDLSPADVVTLALSPDLNRRLLPQIQHMRKGARVVSHDFGLPGYTPDKLIRYAPEMKQGREHLIYVYTLPLHTEAAATPVDKRTGAGINFVPTPQPVAEEMLAMAKVAKDDLVIDLGSGDGRILITAAKDYGARAIGYEINPELVALSRKKAEEDHVQDRVEVRQGNLFDADLTQADVVTLYLSPTMNEKLLPQLNTMKPGARIVSHDFDIPGIKQQTVVKVTPGGAYKRERTIYLWTTPLQRADD
ncbi:MAG: methyltransferase domain-containing protein [Alphaproteobacteria bacterium]|nr:methyltransferase domain-containing protein [Alphaproteobacteria bacterium]